MTRQAERARSRKGFYQVDSVSSFVSNTYLSRWPLTSDATDSVASNDGTGTGVTYSASGALYNATTDKITIANESAFDFDSGDSFTIGFDVYLNNVGTTKFGFGKQLASGLFTGWVIYFTSGVITASLVYSASAQISITYSTLSAATQYEIIMTYDGSKLASGVTLYLDKVAETPTVVQDNLSAQSILNNVTPEIGNRNGAFNLDGYIRDCFVDNTEWSQSNVDSH